MLTQCPACNTTFRVTAEQIKAKGGRVRCGQCQHVFNALDTLIDALPGNTYLPVGEKMLASVAPPQHLPDEMTTGAPNSADDDREQAASTESMVFSESTAEENLVENSATESCTPNLPEQTASTASTDILLDDPFAELPSPATTRRWPWIAGSVLLLIALGMQAVVALRIPLAKSLPAAQPAIAVLCRIAHCTIRLPAQADLISIESSDLHPDPAKPGRLIVSATLKNRAAFSQQFPHLELTLTDIADKAILRKVLPPTAYLPPNIATANGMLSNADIAVNLLIDIDPLTANGYRLYLFYP